MATKNQTGEFFSIIDRFNPFVPTSELYVISEEPNSVNGHGTADYIQTGFDANGNSRKISFNAISKMTTGIFVKIYNKGAYVKDIEKVNRSQVPKAALEKLEKSD